MPSPVILRRLYQPRSKLLAEYAVNGYFGGITTSRATVSPAFNNASGNLEQAGAGEIALVGGDSVACWPGFTNLLTYSNEFDNAIWAQAGSIAITDNGDGTWNLDDQNGSGYGKITEQFTVADDSEWYSASIFVEKDNDETRFPEFQFYLEGGTGQSTNYQLNTKTGATTCRACSAVDKSVDVESVGGFWRLKISLKNNGTGNTTLSFAPHAAVTTTWGNVETTATGSINVKFAQIEKSSFCSPYVPTAGSSVAVDASEPKYAEVSGLTNNLAGRLYWTPLTDDQGTVWILGNYTDANNGWGILHDGTNLIFRNRVSGTNNDATIALNYVVDTEYRIDYRLARDGLDIAVDGTKGTTDSTTTDLTNATNSYYGQDGNDSGHCLCTIREHTEKKIASNFSDAEWLA